MAHGERGLIDRTPQPGTRTGSDAGHGEAPTVEARGAPRLKASEVPSIRGVRLRPFGADATLLNISASGALVECTSRLRLGTAVTVVFDGTFSPAAVEGRVARSAVATVSKNGVLRYHVGIVFQDRIPLDPPAPLPSEAAAQPPATASPEQPPPAAIRAPSSVNRW